MSETGFSSALQKLRKEKGVTQEQLAHHLGVSAQAVSKWENGSYPEGDLLPKLADFFGVSIDYLYGRDNGELSVEQHVLNSVQEVLMECNKAAQNGEIISHEKVFQKILDIIWAVTIAEWPNNKYYYPRPSFPEEAGRTAGCTCDNTGYHFMNLNAGHEYFFLMKQPECGFGKWITEDEKILRFFGFLSDKDNVKLLRFIMTLTAGEYIGESAIAKKTGIAKEKVKAGLDYLYEETKKGIVNNCFYKITILNETTGEEKAYGLDYILPGLVLGIFEMSRSFLYPPEGYQMQIGSRNKSWIDRKELEQ